MEIFNHSTIDNFIQPVLVINMKSEIEVFNRAFAQMTGYNPNRIKNGELFSKYIIIDGIDNLINQIKENGLPTGTVELNARGKDQKEMKLLIKAIPIKENSKLLSIILNMIDITVETKLHKDFKTLELEKRIRLEAEQRFTISNSLLPFKTPEKVLIKGCEILTDFFPAEKFLPFEEDSEENSIKNVSESKGNNIILTIEKDIFLSSQLKESSVIKDFIKNSFGSKKFDIKKVNLKDTLPNTYIIVVNNNNEDYLKHSVLDEYIRLIGVSFENAYLYRKIKQLAIRDGLTSLYNHQHFIVELDKEIKKSIRYKHPVSLLFFDIDYFKQFNDLNGHQIGDEVLKRVAQLLMKALRVTDTIGTWQVVEKKEDLNEDEAFISRYGGEEFAIILPYTNIENARLVAEKLRELIEKIEFPFKITYPNKYLTVSIGVSEITDVIDSSEKLIMSADLALYKAKLGGRNQVQLVDDKLIEQVIKNINIIKKSRISKFDF